MLGFYYYKLSVGPVILSLFTSNDAVDRALHFNGPGSDINSIVLNIRYRLSSYIIDLNRVSQ